MTATVPPQRLKLRWIALPLGVFAAIAGLFAVSLQSGRDPTHLPSMFIGKPAPHFAFQPVEGFDGSGFDETALVRAEPKSVTIVNFWASWCAPCVSEHPQLVALKSLPGVDVFGVDVRDKPQDARQFIARYGNPFTKLGADANGRGSIEWGVYGTPETFIVNAKGEITYKHVGPISEADFTSKIKPAIEAAKR